MIADQARQEREGDGRAAAGGRCHHSGPGDGVRQPGQPLVRTYLIEPVEAGH
jgi:hypothetical protein